MPKDFSNYMIVLLSIMRSFSISYHFYILSTFTQAMNMFLFIRRELFYII